MSVYKPYLIAKYATGLDQELQPWLLPDDSQAQLYDGFVWLGVWEKRPGYNQFATGEEGGSTYTESRVVVTTTAEAYGSGDGTTGPFIHTVANTTVSRGSITITDSVGVQTATDNGDGTFTTSPVGGSGTIDYTTGDMSITFQNAVGIGDPITVTYDYFPGLPVMMLGTYITATNTRQLVVCDTRDINVYNPVTNRLVWYTKATTFSGDNSNFFSWVNYPDSSNNPRLLFSNSIDAIQQWNGTAVSAYAFTLTGVTTLSALHLFHIKDRLILLRTREDGTVYGQRIRISGTGANSDVFDVTATGAGVIDIPDQSWIMSAYQNRDDLIIFTENSVWALQYTSNDVVPFQLVKLDVSRGSGAPYSAITYLNRTSTVSPLGFIATDGYRVDRADNKIPIYSYNDIDQENFKLCYTGVVDADRDHYLLHPSPQQNASDRILVYNYQEDNYSVYRLPMSCMGTFIESFDITWNDLLVYENWDQMAERFGSWYDFAYTKGLPFPVGGGHNGQVWRMNVNGLEDNSVKIRAISVIDTHTLQVETDYNNYELGDYIFITGISGMTEANDKQGAIKSIVTNHRVFQLDMPTVRFSTYTSGGTASRVIPFECLTKKFNPFVNEAAKVRCGYLYMYVSTSNTGITRNVNVSAITQANPAVITANNHGFEDNQEVTIWGVSGMTAINGQSSLITVIDENSFSMNGVDSSAYAAYTTGGVAAGPENCFIDIEVITNDNLDTTQVQDSSAITLPKPYRIKCNPGPRDGGSKRWVKIFINQTGRFIQFKISNTQALSVVQIHAMMPGFAPVGRLI